MRFGSTFRDEWSVMLMGLEDVKVDTFYIHWASILVLSYTLCLSVLCDLAFIGDHQWYAFRGFESTLMFGSDGF